MAVQLCVGDDLARSADFCRILSVVWAATTRSLGAGPVRWPAAVGSAETFKPVGELREGPTMNSFCAESPRD